MQLYPELAAWGKPSPLKRSPTPAILQLQTEHQRNENHCSFQSATPASALFSEFRFEQVALDRVEDPVLIQTGFFDVGRGLRSR
jgi:hypothetical protein